MRLEPKTTEEVAALVPAGRAELAACLFACDIVKFAAQSPARNAATAARDAAVGFVRATAVARGGA
jgi:hypothetical protein